MSIGNNIQSLRKNLGLNQTDFAQKIKTTQSVVSNYEANRRLPDTGFYIKIRNIFHVDINFILTGQGPMFLNENEEDEIPVQGNVYIQKQNRIAVQPYEDTEDYCFVTLVPQRLSAGIGQPDSQIEMVKQIPISRDLIYPYKPQEVAAVMVIGDSMIGSGLCNRDIVFYIKDMLEGNGIYVIEVGNETLVKRLEFDDFENTVTVISDNPSYKQKTISKDSDILRIKGKVKFWFHRDY